MQQMKLTDLGVIWPGIVNTKKKLLGGDRTLRAVYGSDLENWSGRICLDHLSTINPRVKDLGRLLLKENDLVFRVVGQFGGWKVSTNFPEAVLVGQLLGMRLNQEICLPDYLQWYLSSPDVRKLIQSHFIGSAIRTLKTSVFKDLPIRIPPLEFQRKIVAAIQYIEELERLEARQGEERQRLLTGIWQQLNSTEDSMQKSKRSV